MGRLAPEQRQRKYKARIKPEPNFIYHFSIPTSNGSKSDLTCRYISTLEDERYLLENMEHGSNIKMTSSRFAYLVRFNLESKTFIPALKEVQPAPKQGKTALISDSNLSASAPRAADAEDIEFANFIKKQIGKLKDYSEKEARQFEVKTGKSIIEFIGDMNEYLHSDRIKDKNDIPYFIPLLATIGV